MIEPKDNSDKGAGLRDKSPRLGEYLVKIGLFDEETLKQALETQKTSKQRLGQVLTNMGVTDEVAIAKALAVRLKIPYGRIHKATIPDEVISLVPAELAATHMVIPLKKKGNRLLVAMADPLNLYALEDLRFVTRMPIDRAAVPAGDVASAISKYYHGIDLIQDDKQIEFFQDEKQIEFVLDESQIEFVQNKKQEERSLKELEDISVLAPIIKFVNAVLVEAIRLKASDIHIEQQEGTLVVRYRVDGVMREFMRDYRNIHAAVVSRIKIMSEMDIAIKRKPQDGKAQVKYGGKIYDLRISALPTSYGEKVTIRILSPDAAQLKPEDLGFSDEDLKQLLVTIRQSHGIILVTGPTGSGKSTTLYACLNELNSPEVNIVTVEDPVEYEMVGINQVQINPKAGITFAKGLRSILRQDPDIVMVGEIRDQETAITATQAAQTGHLVFSTLHTNDALSAVMRLMDLGIDPFQISSTLIAVIAQRLVRRICEKCKAPETLQPEQLEIIKPRLGDMKDPTFWKGTGCKACHNTGYSGRMGLFELLHLSPALKERISNRVSSETLKQAALAEGFEVMFSDGLRKSLEGLTTVEEVFRVAPYEAAEAPRSHTGVVNARPQDPLPRKGVFSDEVSATGAVAPPKILVVDDDPLALELITHVLNSENYLVVSAKNGVEALQLASTERPNLIVTDYMMPEMDGVMLIKELRSQESTRSIPVIMLTAKDEEEDELEGFDAGADDYLTKPIASKRFLVRIARLLKRSQ